MTRQEILDLIKGEVDTFPYIDTHEHIGVEHGICEDGRQTARQERDLFDLLFSAYFWGILANARVDIGPIRKAVADPLTPEEEKWRAASATTMRRRWTGCEGCGVNLLSSRRRSG